MYFGLRPLSLKKASGASAAILIARVDETRSFRPLIPSAPLDNCWDKPGQSRNQLICFLF